MLNLFVLNETFTNGLSHNLLSIIEVTSILCGIFVIVSKNPIVSVLFLIGLFLNIAGYLMMLGINFIGLSYLLVYVGALSIIIYLSSTELSRSESNVILAEATREKSPDNRGNIDLRYAIIENGVYIHNHDNGQTNTLRRAHMFFYDSNDRSGNTIFNMPFTTAAGRSLVTVSINGVATRGFCVYNPRRGINNSRWLKINPNWLVESQRHSTVTTLHSPLVGGNQGYAILSSQPRVASFQPTSIGSIVN